MTGDEQCGQPMCSVTHENVEGV